MIGWIFVGEQIAFILLAQWLEKDSQLDTTYVVFGQIKQTQLQRRQIKCTSITQSVVVMAHSSGCCCFVELIKSLLSLSITMLSAETQSLWPQGLPLWPWRIECNLFFICLLAACLLCCRLLVCWPQTTTHPQATIMISCLVSYPNRNLCWRPIGSERHRNELKRSNGPWREPVRDNDSLGGLLSGGARWPSELVCCCCCCCYLVQWDTLMRLQFWPTPVLVGYKYFVAFVSPTGRLETHSHTTPMAK